MTDLASWLLARIAEDEAAARAAIERSGAQWHVKTGEYDDAAVVGTDDEYRDHYRGEGGVLWDWEGGFICAYAVSVEHIARHDPARVLAECAAKRRIVEIHNAIPEEDYCAWCDERKPCPTLRLLAQPYAGADGWDEAWKVET